MDNELDKSVINDIDNVFKKNRKKSSMVSNLIIVIKV